MSPDETAPAAEDATPAPPATSGTAASQAPAAAEAGAPPAAKDSGKPAKKRHTGRTIGLVVLALVLIAAGAALVWGLSDTEPKPYAELVPLKQAQDNTAAMAALQNLGIAAGSVDVRDGAIQASYDLRASPANQTWLDAAGSSDEAIEPDDLQRAAIGALVMAVPDATSMAIEQTDGGVHRTTWTVQVADVHAFFAGTLGVAEFEAKIAKS